MSLGTAAHFIRKVRNEMARNKSRSTKPDVLGNKPFDGRFKQPDKVQFINVSLNDADKEWLHNNLPDLHNHIFEFLATVEERLLRITLSPDARSGRWNALALDNDIESAGYGKALSCRGATPITALYGLAYADGHKDGAWATSADSSSDLFG